MFDITRPGPFYEDFSVGATLPPLPSVTLTEADNTLYRAMTGDQHLLSSDRRLAAAVMGHDRGIANPGLVMQYSIGQTTMATRQAIANLYYRSVRILRPVELGETISTVTTVLGLADSTPKGDQYRGKVWLGITTSAAAGAVAAYERCALVRGNTSTLPGHASAIPGPSDATPLAEFVASLPEWDLSPLPRTEWATGTALSDPLRDHIDLAAPLARWSFNQAAVHRDVTATANGRRLVYGGHVQGLAQASLTRMAPGVALVLGWDGCDHIGPAFEGDLLEFRHEVIEALPAGGGRLLRLSVTGTVVSDDGARTDVLRWTPIVWSA
ncbi:MAG TPA: MaoC/PaaZ C-terminal domain-containing protein [Ilumatobacteraceae bacterium]|nr:MaoC/PaaZ C-terminal domain-containing protein [Ilumatobacteraceae bacterium]